MIADFAVLAHLNEILLRKRVKGITLKYLYLTVNVKEERI